MGVMASISGLARNVGHALCRPAARHGDELTPGFFVRPLEDRCVLSAVALPLQSMVHQLTASTGRTIAGGGGAFVVSRQGQNIEVSITGGQQTIDVGGFQSFSAVNLTVRGDASDTICFVGPLDLGGGTLDVMAGSIQVNGSLTSHGGSIDLDAGAAARCWFRATSTFPIPPAGASAGTSSCSAIASGCSVTPRWTPRAMPAAAACWWAAIITGPTPTIADATYAYVGAGRANHGRRARARRRRQGGGLVERGDAVFRQYQRARRAAGWKRRLHRDFQPELFGSRRRQRDRRGSSRAGGNMAPRSVERDDRQRHAESRLQRRQPQCLHPHDG